MLNDAVLVEASQALARRAMANSKPDDRVNYLFRLCLVRLPSAAEEARIAKFFESQHRRFTLDTKRADAVAGSGPNAFERAAWTVTARAILNLDEFVEKE